MNKILLFLLFGIFLSSVAMAQTDSLAKEKIYTSVQVIPSFPGGMQAFYQFLSNTVRYPAEARTHNTQGKVLVSFVVEKDGTLSNFKLWKTVKDGLGEEAMRVIKLSPKWSPGTQNGKAVRVAYTVPISFTLSK
jgi:periplasmic protein TonB